MGFFSHRRRDVHVNPEQKWDFISLNDFKSTSCFTPLAYASLWIALLISLAVYAVDVFTAYQLLAFNKWSSQIEPTQLIPFDISKWIFTVCIILSFANLAYEYFRAITIMRGGSVAECFLDSLAARLESIRMGKGRGYKRFLVFAELTKSKKGAEYIALFTFFSFQTWIRTLLLSGPRQVINGFTLYSVYDAKLQINEANFESSLASFFDKIAALASEEPRQAVILSGMLFTVIIWIFSFLSLLLAGIFFVFFLWSYIPREDGGLTGFCERKVNKRLKQIVSIKINKAMAEEERERKKAELRSAKKNGENRPMTMKPSLPVLGGDNMPAMPTLERIDTFATFSEKPSRPTTPGSFEMNALGRQPPMPLRSDTRGTAASQYSSNTSLLAGAADMGMARREPAVPTLSPLDPNGYPPSRTGTPGSNRSYGPGSQPQRMASNGSSLRNAYTASPAPFSSETMPSLPPPVKSPLGPYNGYGGPGSRPYPGDNRSPYPGDNRSPYQADNMSPHPGNNRLPYSGDNRTNYSGDNRSNYSGDNRSNYSGDGRSPHPGNNRLPYSGVNNLPYQDGNNGWPSDDRSPHFGDNRSGYPMDNRTPFDDPSSGRASPAPSTNTYHSNPMSPRGMGPDGYPIRSATNPMPARGPPQFSPSRAMTQPMQPFHQPTGSNGSLSSMQSAAPGYQAYQPYHQPTASNSSLRNMQSAALPSRPYHQASTSNSSLRNMVNAVTYEDPDNRSDYGLPGRPNPVAANSQGPFGNVDNRSEYGVSDRSYPATVNDPRRSEESDKRSEYGALEQSYPAIGNNPRRSEDDSRSEAGVPQLNLTTINSQRSYDETDILSEYGLPSQPTPAATSNQRQSKESDNRSEDGVLGRQNLATANNPRSSEEVDSRGEYGLPSRPNPTTANSQRRSEESDNQSAYGVLGRQNLATANSQRRSVESDNRSEYGLPGRPNPMATNSQRRSVESDNRSEYGLPGRPNPVTTNNQRRSVESDNRSEYGLPSRPNPVTANNQSGRRQSDDETNDNDRWKLDLERGGPTY